MSLAGSGAICIWNDIAPEGRAEFYAWHVHEHMPERAAVPGFLRSRRFIALDAATQPEFFTLYETRDPGVHTSAAYLARLNAPTPWTKTATQAFRNTSRALTHVEASLGPGAGGVLATLRLSVIPGREEEAWRRITGEILPELAGMAEITGAHLCRTNRDASASRTTESRDRTDILEAPDWVILVEACTEAPARKAAARAQEALDTVLNRPAIAGFYRLEYQC